MVGACLFVAAMPEIGKKAIGIFGALFFGYALFLIAKQLLKKSPLLVFDKDGIHSFAMEYGTIPWSEIHSISVGTVNGQTFLSVHVENPEPFLQRLPQVRQALARSNMAIGFSPISIGLQGMTPGLNEAKGYLRANHPDLLTE